MSATATAPMSEPTTTAAPAGQEQLPTAGVWRQTALLMRWQLRRSLPQLPLVMVVQTLMAVATVLGYGLIAGDAGHEAGLYLATGAPAISLITIGLIMAPQWVSQARTEGSLDWMRTLPVPRVSFLLADLLLWTVMALPGLVLGVAVGAARFGVALDPAWWLVPGALLVALTSACIGYAVANLLAPPVAQVLSQVLVFVIMLFSPFSFPASRLPGWARGVHEWLPFEPMARVVRAGLCSQEAVMTARAWIVLGVWAVLAVAAASWALGRRS